MLTGLSEKSYSCKGTFSMMWLILVPREAINGWFFVKSHPSQNQTLFTCLLNVHKCLQTLKHNIKVFNEHFFDVYKSLKNVLFWLGCYYNINELRWLLRNYCTNVRKSGETSRQMLSDIYLRHNCLISCSKFLIFLLYLWCA